MHRVAQRAANVVCWAARIGGLLFALLFLAFVIGEGLPPWSPHALGWLAINLGLLIAWKWEGLGGVITLAGYILFFFVDPHFLAYLWRPLTAVPAVAGALHILCWFELGMRNRRPQKLPQALWIVLGVFVLLSANEIFGNPPLMTPSRPSSAVVGSWHSPDVVLAVSPDGRLAGTIAGKRLAGARVSGNRSWFGKVMHWRTDYSINGKLDGEPVRGWIMVDGFALKADLISKNKMRSFEVVK
ncbi:MAG TPA: hypothetical protein VKB88_27230 [Bryobacteraceae bacterium]|nr:hypothetical protein [Bryobacteraceae bacterium]